MPCRHSQASVSLAPPTTRSVQGHSVPITQAPETGYNGYPGPAGRVRPV